MEDKKILINKKYTELINLLERYRKDYAEYLGIKEQVTFYEDKAVCNYARQDIYYIDDVKELLIKLKFLTNRVFKIMQSVKNLSELFHSELLLEMESTTEL